MNGYTNWGLIVALLLFGFIVVFFQFRTQQKLEESNQKYIQSELRKIARFDLDSISVDYSDEKSLAAEKVEFQLEELRDEIRNTEKSLKSEHNYFITFGLPLTLIALIGYFWSVYSFLKRQAEEQVKVQIGPIVEQYRADLLQLLNENSEEKILIANKLIAVVGEEDLNINRTLRIIGFSSNNLKQYDPGKKDSYDILFINNSQGVYYDGTEPKKQALLNLVKKESDEVGIFYYCETGINFPLKEVKDPFKCNFATNPSQLFGNLLNSLKYQDKLKKLKLG